MSIRKIVTPPDPVLRTPTKRIHAFTSDLQTLIADMVETMRQAPGVGLAAPQVGVSQRVIVVEYGPESEDPEEQRKNRKLYSVVNPEIIRHSRSTELGTEGCLSLPHIYGDVERYSAVTVKGFDRQGQPFQLQAEGWLARIFQHEIDHVDGILFTDRATDVWKVEDEESGEVIPRA